MSIVPGSRSNEELLRLPLTEKITVRECIQLKTLLQGAKGIAIRPSDLGHFGRLITSGTIAELQEDFDARVVRLGSRNAAIDELASCRWATCAISISHLLFAFSTSYPGNRPTFFAKLAFYLSLPLPADALDILGASTLRFALNFRSLDLAYGQMLYEAGADINSLDRMGHTQAHTSTFGWSAGNADAALRALEWLIQRGCNFDCPAKGLDGETITGRLYLLQTATAMSPSVGRRARDLLASYDDRRREAKGKACGFCLGLGVKGRAGKEELQCGRCFATLYCGKECQKLDWPHHKKSCSPPP